MKVYTNNKFSGHWPVGTAAVVVAESESQAAAILNAKLEELGLPGDAEQQDMSYLGTRTESVRILCDGNY